MTASRTVWYGCVMLAERRKWLAGWAIQAACVCVASDSHPVIGALLGATIARIAGVIMPRRIK